MEKPCTRLFDLIRDCKELLDDENHELEADFSKIEDIIADWCCYDHPELH